MYLLSLYAGTVVCALVLALSVFGLIQLFKEMAR